jgi:hypothetical protein
MKKSLKNLLVYFFGLLGMAVFTNELFAHFQINLEPPYPISYARIFGLALLLTISKVYYEYKTDRKDSKAAE